MLQGGRKLGEGVVVVGAGVAGLAAAGLLRRHGVPTTLIEATSSIGGRARTTWIGADPFDHGATWLHDAARNPLAALARPEDDLVDTDRLRQERVSLAGRPATPADLVAYHAAWDRLDSLAAPLLAQDEETLASAVAGMARDPWAPLVALWEGPIIAAADPDRLGLQDWHANRLDGRNLAPRHGMGAFVARRLATEATLDTPATRIVWGARGVRVETSRGTLAAAAAIVTVSTGVLASGAIRFTPALPAPVQAAIHALPMGLLDKIALPAETRLGLEPDTVLVDRDGCMTFNAWHLGRAHLMGFVGGGRAWSLEQGSAGPGALETLARDELRRMLGAEALAHVGPAAAVTRWGADPAFRGAYAYAGPGDSGQRATLADAFPGEHLVFAGEALRSDGLAGTVGGAWLSGTQAARRMIAAIPA